MTNARGYSVVLAVSIVCATAAAGAVEKPVKTFAKDWEGRRVVLKRTLYTLIYDEVGRLGATRHGKVEGLTVATPSSGTYYRFAGRRPEDEIVDRDPNRLVDLVSAHYQRSMHLEVGTISAVTPVMLMQYPAGVELVVRSVQVDRDRVRLVLHKAEPGAEGDLATSLTIQWPTHLSTGFTERAMVEALMLQFVGVVSR